MGIMSAISSGLAGLGNAIATPATKWIEGRNDLRKIKARGKQAITVARIRAEIAQIEGEGKRDLSYDLLALENQKTSWKDEYIIIVFTFPFMISFLSPFIDEIFNTDIAPRVADAWKTVGSAPDWYQWVMIGIVAATFGLRWLFRRSNPLGNKKGPEPKP
jgi:hypothetical protein